MCRSIYLVLFSLLSISVAAQTTGTYYNGTVDNTTVAGNLGNDPVDGKYTISAEGIRASFVPYGASISNLYLNDSKGVERDVVVGFDTAWLYEVWDHGHYGAVPGRYANRIVNSTFTIDGETSHILPNENNNTDTLHGGPNGWDWRNFTVVAHTTDSLTFSLVDQDGEQGFPGQVIAYITYTVTPYEWREKMVALATTKKTPIMLSSHVYWNLDGFQNPETPLALNHTLWLPDTGLRVNVTPSTQVPTGTIDTNWRDQAFDFWSRPRQMGWALDDPMLNRSCGKACVGYNVCYLNTRRMAGVTGRGAGSGGDWWRDAGPVARLRSDWSGIQVDVYSDQDAVQLYSCNNQNGTTPLKTGQGLAGRNATLEKYGCVVLEVEDWISGINYPEWGREERQVFGPGTGAYVLEAAYKFRVD